MRKLKVILFCFLLSLILVLSSCVGKVEENLNISSSIDEIDFEFSLFTNETPGADSRLEDINRLFVENKSCILISQRTDHMSCNFNEGSSNCYKYTYYKNNNANWENDYNFKSQNPMNWKKIIMNGTFGNTYSFGALFFPLDFKYTEEVNADQSDENSYLECDILGAYHRTSQEYERLRFEFNHLMCKLHINLYIPAYEEDTNTGFDLDRVTATAISFRTDYELNWADRSGEEPPIALPWSDDYPDKKRIKDITMYQSDYQDNITLSEMPNFDIYEIEEDRVRKYSFDMLFPQQTTQGEMIRFILSRDDMTYNYLFKSDKLTVNKDNFKFTAGTVTQLELYLPRSGNEVVLLRAYLNDWNEAQTSFTVTEENKDFNEHE